MWLPARGFSSNLPDPIGRTGTNKHQSPCPSCSNSHYSSATPPRASVFVGTAVRHSCVELFPPSQLRGRVFSVRLTPDSWTLSTRRPSQQFRNYKKSMRSREIGASTTSIADTDTSIETHPSSANDAESTRCTSDTVFRTENLDAVIRWQAAQFRTAAAYVVH